LENLNGRHDEEDLGSIILKLIFGKWHEKVWTGFIWLRIGTSGEFL
jgi:hypothetical protein